MGMNEYSTVHIGLWDTELHWQKCQSLMLPCCHSIRLWLWLPCEQYLNPWSKSKHARWAMPRVVWLFDVGVDALANLWADLGTPPLLEGSEALLLAFWSGSEERPSTFCGGLKGGELPSFHCFSTPLHDIKESSLWCSVKTNSVSD